MLVEVTEQVLTILDVLVPTERQAKQVRALKVVVTLVKLAFALLRKFEEQVSSVDHGWAVP